MSEMTEVVSHHFDGIGTSQCVAGSRVESRGSLTAGPELIGEDIPSEHARASEGADAVEALNVRLLYAFMYMAGALHNANSTSDDGGLEALCTMAEELVDAFKKAQAGQQAEEHTMLDAIVSLLAAGGLPGRNYGSSTEALDREQTESLGARRDELVKIFLDLIAALDTLEIGESRLEALCNMAEAMQRAYFMFEVDKQAAQQTVEEDDDLDDDLFSGTARMRATFLGLASCTFGRLAQQYVFGEQGSRRYDNPLLREISELATDDQRFRWEEVQSYTGRFLSTAKLISADNVLCKLPYCPMYDIGSCKSEKETLSLETLKKYAVKVCRDASVIPAVHKYLMLVSSFSSAGFPLKPDTSLAQILGKNEPVQA